MERYGCPAVPEFDDGSAFYQQMGRDMAKTPT